ncbi:MAG: SpoIIE family protein phosphatase [Actinomycetota bacterium]
MTHRVRSEAISSDFGLIRRYAPGEFIFRKGDAAGEAMILMSGHASVIDDGEHLEVIGPGDVVPASGATGEGRRVVTLVALDDVEVLATDVTQLHQLLRRSPESFWTIFMTIVSRVRQVAAREIAERHEHLALRSLQETLLPDLDHYDTGGGLSVEAVWEPCTFASGDFYDVIRIDGERQLFVVADVAGHGAQSALAMGIARAELHHLARSFRRTDELLLGLDGYLRDNGPPRQLSLVVCVYDERTGDLEYSIAGHPRPMLWRDGQVRELKGPGGVLLAMPWAVDAGYTRNHVALQPGDHLLMYTDGLIEVPTEPGGELLGRGGLTQLFAATMNEESADRAQRLVDRVNAADNSDAADDDRTAMLISIAAGDRP